MDPPKMQTTGERIQESLRTLRNHYNIAGPVGGGPSLRHIVLDNKGAYERDCDEYKLPTEWNSDVYYKFDGFQGYFVCPHCSKNLATADVCDATWTPGVEKMFERMLRIAGDPLPGGGGSRTKIYFDPTQGCYVTRELLPGEKVPPGFEQLRIP